MRRRFGMGGWGWLAAVYVACGALVTLSLRTSRTGRVSLIGVTLGTLAVAIVFSRIASPLVFVPIAVCATVLSVSNIAWLNERPWAVYIGAVTVATVPFVLEWLGVLSHTATVTAGAIELRSEIFATSGPLAVPALALANAVFLVIVARFAVLIARDRRSAQRRLTIQAWHLGQLLPETPQVVAAPRATRA